MKIQQKAKKTAPPHPQVAEFINYLAELSVEAIGEALADIDHWKWPRSDLNAWVKVLNKFDSIMEELIRDYDLDRVQINPFTPSHKKLLCELLRFERLLLENSTNRKLFSSYDRLSSLTFTMDLDVLTLTLNLLLRPAQQYSGQPSILHALQISTSRLTSLAKRWPNLREHGIEMVDLVGGTSAETINSLPAEASEVHFTFYRKESEPATDKEKEKEKGKPEDTAIVEAPSAASPAKSPTVPKEPTISGPVTIRLDSLANTEQASMSILAETMDAYQVPSSEKFELMCRIRTALALKKGNEADREKLVVARLLATAIFAHTHNDGQVQTALFTNEPDVINHIADLLQLDKGASITVQTAALAALDSLARHSKVTTDVFTAVNAAVNHGILMGITRKAVTDMASSDSTLPHPFVDALLSFVTFVASHATGGTMIIGAGLIPLLIQVIDNKQPSRLSVISKTLQLVDTVLYGYANAFQIFCNNRGVETVVERIEAEVNYDLENFRGKVDAMEPSLNVFGQLPYDRSALLKHLMRSIYRMMQTSGGTEGLRGLIDSSLPKSVQKIMENRGLFGQAVLPFAINVMSTFIHNEPTSLATIQEAGLPETFYRVVERGLEPAIEVLQAVPNAIGALCLNQVGQDQLAARPTILPGIFTIFTSEVHLKVLQEKENAAVVGSALDELIRHHPYLKTSVFESINATLDKIENMGNHYEVSQDIMPWYRLSLVPATTEERTDAMEGVEATALAAPAANATPAGEGKDDGVAKPHDNDIISYIDVLGRFLEGLFQHSPHVKDFITTFGGLQRIGRLTGMPCLPYDFGSLPGSDSLIQVLRFMSDADPAETLLHLYNAVKDSLADTKEFWGSLEPTSKLAPALDVTDEEALLEANRKFRALTTLHIRTTFLSDVYSAVGYSLGRSAATSLPSMVGPGTPDILADLGALHRACVWENILLKAALRQKGIDIAETTPTTLEDSPEQTGATSTGSVNVGAADSPNTSPKKKEAGKSEAPRDFNAKALRHLVSQIPTSLVTLFQATMKPFVHTRRTPDVTQKKLGLVAASGLADILLKHLRWTGSDDRLSSYAYDTVMIGLAMILLFDERGTSTNVHALLLVAFRGVGGFETILEVAKRYTSAVERIIQVNEDDRSDADKHELIHVFGGLKVFLHLAHSLVSSKPLFESGQTEMLITRDKKDTDRGYFEPHHFLVKTRLEILPFIRHLWEAPWLTSAPIGIAKSVVQTVLELVAAEHEEFDGNLADPQAPAAPGSTQTPAAFRVDEDRARQLMDMGFPRSAVERALARARNNLTAATEILLSQPFPIPAEPEPEPQVAPGANPAAEPEAADVPMEEAAPEAAPVEAAEPAPAAEETPAAIGSGEEEHPLSKEPSRSLEDLRKELDNARLPIRQTLGRQSLRLVDEHPNLIFDVRKAFTLKVGTDQERTPLRSLIDDIKSFSPAAYDVQEQPFGNRCHLLALVLNEGTPVSSLKGSDAKDLMDVLVAVLLSNPFGIDQEHSSVPKWLSRHLLVTETILLMADEPSTVVVPKEEEEIVTQNLLVGSPYTEARTNLFDLCLKLLSLPDLPQEEFTSVLRLLVVLTREHKFGTEFAKRGGFSSLMRRFTSDNKERVAQNCQDYVLMILRHVVEDDATKESLMRAELKRFFSHSRNRVMDVNAFIRNCSHMALRDPSIFIKSVNSVSQLVNPNSGVHHIGLKTEDNPSTNAISAEPRVDGSTETQMQIDDGAQRTLGNETAESVVHFLLSELLRVWKPSVESLTDQTPNVEGGKSAISAEQPLEPRAAIAEAQPSSSADDKMKNAETKAKAKGEHEYACLLMQTLCEMLSSYDSCKVAFLTFSNKKRAQTPAKEGGARYRHSALNFFLAEIVPVGGFKPDQSPNLRNILLLAHWGMSVIASLCVDVSMNHASTKDVSAELLSVRKFVLDTLGRSIKEALSVESPLIRYSRVHALATVCHRLLLAPFPPANQRGNENVTLPIAKLMLDKNYVATFTNALSEVDLNYPGIRSLITSIVRPLEYLTKVAIKIGKLDKVKGSSIQDHSSSSSDENGDDMDEDEREETPDLYRNSSLGMFGGEIAEQRYAEEDEMDEDELEEDEDVEMEFGEETGSEDTSNTEEDVEAELELATGSEGGWQDEEEDEDEDDEGGGDDDDDDDAEDEDDEADEVANADLDAAMAPVEITLDGGGDEDDDEGDWEDVPGGAVERIVQLAADAEDEEDIGAPDIEDDQEVDEADVISEADIRDALASMEIPPEFRAEINVQPVQGIPLPIFNVGLGEMNGFSRNDRQSIFVPQPGFAIRRRGLDPMDAEFFGHTRPAPAPEPPVHPLLVDSSSGTQSGPAISGVSIPSLSIAADGFTDVLQAMEDLVGGQAIDVIQQIISRGVQGGGPGQGIIAHLNRGGGMRRGAVRIERAPRAAESRSASEFHPCRTMVRWSEEIKTLYGKVMADFLAKLSNHVVIALLPAAREAARLTKLKEEKEAEERRVAEELEKEEAERVAKERAEASAPDTEDTTGIPSTTPPQASPEDENEPTVHPAEQGDTPLESAADGPAVPPLVPDAVPSSGDSEAMVVDPPAVEATNTSPDAPDAVAADAGPEAGPSTAAPAEAPERVTVMIHGSAVDITDTGIDPTFLEALPDDMREEVLNQHFREQRDARVQRPADSQISPEFLDALPPEIRAELLQQETMDRDRQRRDDAIPAPAGATTTGPAEMDPASFIASLDPQLRQVVLMDADDGFIQTLPSHMIAETGIYRDGSMQARAHPPPARRPDAASTSERKPPIQRDSVQLLDKNGVATLIRLIFWPQLLRKNHLFQVLVYLCENSKSRADLLNLLLSVLQDGTGDLAAVDRSFSQMSVKGSKTPAQHTPKSASKQRVGADYFTSIPTSQLPSDTNPDLIAQRCLEALSYIVHANEASSLFFLKEHEFPAALRRSTSRKGKGKERQAPYTHYPLVLLLSLLDRASLLKTPSTMDKVADLLATVTRQLATLKDASKDAPSEPAAVAPPTSGEAVAPETAATVPGNSSSGPGPAEEQVETVVPNPQEPSTSANPIAENKTPTLSPPHIPHNVLRLVVNLLTVGECSSRTFQQTLALIQNLSHIPEVRDVVAQELRSRAQDLGLNLTAELNELEEALQKSNSETGLSQVVSMKFSPASSNQAKLLRLLKTIDYMYSPKKAAPAADPVEKAVPPDEKVSDIYEAFQFNTLWQKLGGCLAAIEESSQVDHVATVLLPLIESLMVVCKYVGPKQANGASRALQSAVAAQSPKSVATPRESMEDLFVSFTDAHRKVLNVMVRNNPNLMSGSFSLLIQNPRVLDFDNKRNYFTQQLHRRPHSREHHGTLQLNLRRQRVFEDSFQYLQRKTGDQIKYGKLSVRFYDEEGVDAGGVTREWFQILARQMFNPDYALFQPCAADKLTYQPNRASWVNPEHLAFFKFVGRVIGKAIYDGRLLDAYFARSWYRQLLGKPVDYRDVEWVDPEYYNSLCWILENDPSPLELTFSVEADEYGLTKVIPLKDNGTSIAVTEENRREFVQLSAQYRLYTSIKDQIEALLAGFYEIIPKDLISIFNEQEVELLISGTPDIDVDEWRAATDYNGYTSSDPTIVWFWRAMKSFNRDERAKVLSFATGTSRVPLGGFSDLQGVQGVQRFSIHKAYGDLDRLPQAHTCFNQIDLPPYSSYEMLRQQVLLAISEGGEGFGFA